MFVPSMVRRGPGLTRAQGSNGQPVDQSLSMLCHCGCHPPQKPPPAVEARLCRECADERFAAWQSLLDVMMRED